MWYPRKLKIERFISHLDSEYEFQNGKAVLIVGENLDDDSQSSNGSGKSAIIEAIIFALTGDSFRKVRAIDLIMNGEKMSVVTFQMENTMTKQFVEITRTLDVKKSSNIQISVNNEVEFDTPNKGTSAEANKFILDLIDISKEDLVNYFIVSKEKYQSFLNASDTKKKEIISRFSGANLIANIDSEIEKDEKVIIKEIEGYDSQKTKIEGQIEAYEEQIENQESEETFEELRKEQITNLNNQKNEALDEVKTFEKDIKDTEKLVKSTNSEISKISTKKFDDQIKKVDVDKEDLKTQISDLKTQISENDDLITSINKNLKGVVECPECSHEFSVTNKDFKVDLAKQMLPGLEEDLENQNSELEDLQTKDEALDELKDNAKKQIRTLNNQKNELEQKVIQLNQKIKSREAQKKLKNDFISGLDTEIQLAEEREYFDESKATKTKIKQLKKELEEIQEKISNCDLKKQGVVEWYYNFKKFKTHLANKSIKSVEAFSNMFLTKMKTNLNIKIEGYKLLANGNLKENITVEVLRNGLMEGLFDKFSSGEKTRVDISCIFALQKLINLNSRSGGIDLLVLDEIIESVDAQGVTEILKNINQLNQTVLVITHASQVSEFDCYTKVVKEGGYSKIL